MLFLTVPFTRGLLMEIKAEFGDLPLDVRVIESAHGFEQVIQVVTEDGQVIADYSVSIRAIRASPSLLFEMYPQIHRCLVREIWNWFDDDDFDDLEDEELLDGDS